MPELMQKPPQSTAKPAPVSLIRRCACGGVTGPGGECAECAAKRQRVQRAASGAGPASNSAMQSAQGIAARPGVQLEPGIRAFMERRIGQASRAIPINALASGEGRDEPGDHHERVADAIGRYRPMHGETAPRFDFRQVRIHNDRFADETAQAIGANAYTFGSHIAFRANRFNSRAASGRDLLAHELTHVVQQSNASRAIQRQKVGDTRVTYDEHVQTTTHTPSNPTGIWKGKIIRTRALEKYTETESDDEDTPSTKEWEEVESKDHEVNIEFDPKACEVRLPLRLSFHNPSFVAPKKWDPCNEKPPNATPRTPLANSTFTQLRADFTSQLNSGLNGWYFARISGCKKGPCAGKEIPIRVDAHDGGAKEARDQDVNLINATGRSCVQSTGVYIYAPDGKRKPRMWVHEGGHFLLGFGDEYAEEGRPDEFVSTDYSAMGEGEETRFTSFHERHFAFVPVFLDNVMSGLGHPGCHARLIERRRPLATSINMTVGAGLANFPEGRGNFFDLGIEFGRSDSRERTVEKVLALHARLLSVTDGEISSAVLFGARLGIERRWGGSGLSLSLGGFGELGGGGFGIGTTEGTSLGAFGEVGAYVDLRAPLRREKVGLRLEGAAGTRFGTTGQIGDLPAGSPPVNGPMAQWVRLGLSVVFPF